MASLPKDLASATRRRYAQILARLLHLAVYPLKLIPVSPLPRGFLPKVKRTKATAWLYPSEDAQLLPALPCRWSAGSCTAFSRVRACGVARHCACSGLTLT